MRLDGPDVNLPIIGKEADQDLCEDSVVLQQGKVLADFTIRIIFGKRSKTPFDRLVQL